MDFALYFELVLMLTDILDWESWENPTSIKTNVLSFYNSVEHQKKQESRMAKIYSRKSPKIEKFVAQNFASSDEKTI